MTTKINKYLEKLASDFDFDAHEAMKNSVKNPSTSGKLAGGWKGDLDAFSKVSTRSAAKNVAKQGAISKFISKIPKIRFPG